MYPQGKKRVKKYQSKRLQIEKLSSLLYKKMNQHLNAKRNSLKSCSKTVAGTPNLDRQTVKEAYNLRSDLCIIASGIIT